MGFEAWSLYLKIKPFFSCVQFRVIAKFTFFTDYSLYFLISLMSRAFAYGSGDLGSIPSQVIPKTQKMVIDAALLNTQHSKLRIKNKVEQSRERSCALPYKKGNLRITLDRGRQLDL